MVRPGPKPLTLEDLKKTFWARVKVTDDKDSCWLWLKARHNKKGYGIVQARGISKIPLYAHRLAWMITHGPIPAGAQILHHCDNTQCCRPSHLFLGNHQINMADMISKGRMKIGGDHRRFLK